MLNLLKFNVPLTQIDREASNKKLEARAGSPYVLLAVYGALLNPHMHFWNRLKESYMKLHGGIEEKDITSFFLGLYKVDGKRLNFQKKDTRNQDTDYGKATILTAPKGTDYTIMSVYAIPRIALQLGSRIMTSEACISYDFYEARNHYIIIPNSDFELVILPNDNSRSEPVGSDRIPQELKVIKNFQCYYFVAANHHLERQKQLLAEKTYKRDILASLDFMKSNWGYDVPEEYIQYIQDNY